MKYVLKIKGIKNSSYEQFVRSEFLFISKDMESTNLYYSDEYFLIMEFVCVYVYALVDTHLYLNYEAILCSGKSIYF